MSPLANPEGGGGHEPTLDAAQGKQGLGGGKLTKNRASARSYNWSQLGKKIKAGSAAAKKRSDNHKGNPSPRKTERGV